MSKDKYIRKERFNWRKGDVIVTPPDKSETEKPKENRKQEALKKTLEVLNELVSELGSEEE